MREIKNIAVIGAGAMGATFASLFHKVPEFSTIIIARDQRYDTLKKEGIKVNGETLMVTVVRPDEAAAPADLLLVGLKHSHLADAIPDMRPFVDSGTTIISVMNGLDSEEILGAAFGMEKMLYCVSVGIDALREGDGVIYTRLGKLFFGHPDNAEISDQVRRVQAAFDRAGIPYETPADMMRAMWWKFMLNVGLNQASAVMRAPFGVFQTSAEAWAVAAMLMREVLAVAKCAGGNLSEADIGDAYKI